MDAYVIVLVIAGIAAISALSAAIAGYFGARAAGPAMKKIEMQQKSVTARLRNKVTKKMMDDALDGTKITVGPLKVITLREAVDGLFPSAMEELEDMRKKNPQAWAENIAVFVPVLFSLKRSTEQINSQTQGLFTQGAGILTGVLGSLGGIQAHPSRGPVVGHPNIFGGVQCGNVSPAPPAVEGALSPTPAEPLPPSAPSADTTTPGP